ncbi:ribosome biogenesis protein NOP53 [Larus michahellis]|uniref:ribosome biogenesis protein NOP53 n=1 Tax=Larus michahellis TaxID=119627 RepID=UPI003D9ABA05
MAAPAAAPSAPFLGLGPGSRDPGAPRSRRRASRGPRNRKKGWKRWAGPEARLGRQIGDFLEDVGLQQRAAGGLIAEQPDEGLFFVDTGNAEKDRRLNEGREKPLHVDLVLQPDSKVPPPKNILAYQVPNGRKEKRRREFWARKAAAGELPGGERRLRERLRRRREAGGGAPPGKREEKGRSDPQRGFYDIWGDDDPLERALAGQDGWFLQQTKKQRVKRPARLQTKPSQVPAVEVIAAGGSYNPTFEDHQALLLRAHEVEVRKKKAEDKVERQLRIPAGAQLPTPETVFQEQCEGLLEESGEEEEAAEGEETAPQAAAPRGEKKTEQQRRREKEARASALRQRQEKAARCRRQELFRLRGLRRQLERWEAELLRRRGARKAKRRARDALPRRLGRLRYEEPSPEVQLSEELAESLRALKPEGSVLRDRFKSLQKRSLIEPRERAKFKRRYRLKYVEKRAFREVTL